MGLGVVGGGSVEKSSMTPGRISCYVIGEDYACGLTFSGFFSLEGFLK